MNRYASAAASDSSKTSVRRSASSVAAPLLHCHRALLGLRVGHPVGAKSVALVELLRRFGDDAVDSNMLYKVKDVCFVGSQGVAVVFVGKDRRCIVSFALEAMLLRYYLSFAAAW